MHLSLYFEKLLSLAQTGHNYSSDLPYHQAIYRQMLNVCGEFISDRPDFGSSEEWHTLVRDLGVITPKAGSVVAVTRTDGEVLVLERPSGRWCLPCGYADIGETPEATALREVSEETGLDINLEYLLGIATTLADRAIPFMWEAVYIARLTGGQLTLSHEHVSAQWVRELDDRPWHSTHSDHLRKVFEFLGARDTSAGLKIK